MIGFLGPDPPPPSCSFCYLDKGQSESIFESWFWKKLSILIICSNTERKFCSITHAHQFQCTLAPVASLTTRIVNLYDKLAPQLRDWSGISWHLSLTDCTSQIYWGRQNHNFQSGPVKDSSVTLSDLTEILSWMGMFDLLGWGRLTSRRQFPK